MSIADKITTIAENEQKVYDAGKESMVNKNVITKETVTDKVICVEDVSEIIHKPEIKLTSDTITDFSNVKVTIAARNMFNTTVSSQTKNGIAYTVNEDKSVTISGTSTNSTLVLGYMLVTAGKRYTFRADGGGIGSYRMRIFHYDSDNNITVSTDSVEYFADNHKIFPEGTTKISVDLYVPNGITVSKKTFYPMVSLSNTTKYEPFRGVTVYANADGTVTFDDDIVDFSPVMHVYTNSSDVDITMSYYKSSIIKEVNDVAQTYEYEYFWDRFWMRRHENDFYQGFTGSGWDNATFRPPENTTIYPDTCAEMFSRCKITDLENLLAKRNAKIDTVNSKYVDEMYTQSTVTHVPELNASSSYGCPSLFSNDKNLVSVRKLILKEAGSQSLSNAFYNCSALKYIRIEGNIGVSVSFANSPLLTHDSLFGEIATEEQISAGKNILLFNGQYYYGGIIIALRDFVSEGSTTTRTLTLGTTNLAKLTDEEKAIATQKGWTLA